MADLFTVAAPAVARPFGTLSFFVPGIPAPGGSKTAQLIRRNGGQIVTTATGRPLITMRDAGKNNKEWRASVAYFARQEYRDAPLDVPLEIEVVFTMPRPKCHFGSGKNAGRLKESAPKFHTNAPDSTKLLRSTEDALTGVLWRDDSIIAIQHVTKVYGDRPGARIILRAIREGGSA